MMTEAANISGADDKNVFLYMASNIYNNISYIWGRPGEDDNYPLCHYMTTSAKAVE